MLITASGRAGLLHDVQREVVERIINLGQRRMMDAGMPADDAFDRIHVQRPQRDDFHTLAGFAISQFQRIPTVGDHFTWEEWRFEVVDMDGRRIDKLLLEHGHQFWPKAFWEP